MRKRLKSFTPDIVRKRIVSWFRTRVDVQPAIALIRRQPVPIHRHSWIYSLGDAALFLFGLQLFSGCLLMLYYQPTEATAQQSITRIMNEVPFGWLIRSIHVWGASFYVGMVCLHFVTVLFSRAYRKPRELVWISGVVMLFLALGSGFSGYLLPWNELSFYATAVGTQIPGTLPVIGDFIVHFLRGADQVTGQTITRFFAAHVMILPLAFGFVLSIHVFLSRVRGVSLPVGMCREEVKDRRPFFSEFLLLEVCLWLLLFGSIVTLSVFFPAEIGVKADSLKPAPQGIKPEWYFLFAFETLKYLPEMVGVAFFALVGLLLLVLPLLDRNAGREEKNPTLTAVFLAFLLYALVFEILALIAPGVERPPEELAAQTYRVPESVVSLALLWSVIGLLIYYLRRLVVENTRIRKLYKDDS